MAKALCIVLRRPPYGGIHAAEAVRHLNGGVANGLETTLLLVSDGVYLARAAQAAASGWTSLSDVLVQVLRYRGRLPDGSENQAWVYAHGPSLAARGLGEGDLLSGVEVMDDDGAALLLAGSHATLVY